MTEQSVIESAKQDIKAKITAYKILADPANSELQRIDRRKLIEQVNQDLTGLLGILNSVTGDVT
jgi:hypothetical protein